MIHKPLWILLFLPSLLQHAQWKNKFKGVIKEKSSQFITLDHTTIVKLQWRKRWFADSSTIPHKTHLDDSSGGKQLRLARFLLVGIRSKRSFQEKATTFKGALLSQIVSKTLNSLPHSTPPHPPPTSPTSHSTTLPRIPHHPPNSKPINSDSSPL